MDVDDDQSQSQEDVTLSPKADEDEEDVVDEADLSLAQAEHNENADLEDDLELETQILEPKVEADDSHALPEDDDDMDAQDLGDDIENEEPHDHEQDPGPLCDADRMEFIETGLKTCRDRLDGFGQELKLALVEINIVFDWIKDRFGVQLIDKASQLRKHLHDFEEIEELTKTLSLLKNGSRRSARQANARWTKEQNKRLNKRKRRKYYASDDEDEEDEDLDDEDEDDDDDDDSINVRPTPKTEQHSEDDDFMFDPPEVLLHEDSSDAEKPKKKSGRGRPVKKVNYSELDDKGKNKKKRGRRKAVVAAPSNSEDKNDDVDALSVSENDGDDSESKQNHKFIPKLESFLRSEKFRKRQVFPDAGTYEMLISLLTKKIKTGNGHDYDQKVKQKFEVLKREAGEGVLVWKESKKRILKQDDFLKAIQKAHDKSGHRGRDCTLMNLQKTYHYIPIRLVQSYVKDCDFCYIREPGCDFFQVKEKKRRYKRRSKEEPESEKGTEEQDGEEGGAPKKRGRPKKKPEEKAHQIPDRTPMQCAECGKILKGPGSLKSHMNMHADLRPYPCLEEGCGKRFRVKNKLALHMMIHRGDKKEQCRFCGRLFYFAKDLARHERTHTGEKPHPCMHCPKSFNVKQHLTLHIRTHTGERPYECPVCHKRFSQANSLRIHKKIHVKAANAAMLGTVTRKPRGPPKTKTNSNSNAQLQQQQQQQSLHHPHDQHHYSDSSSQQLVTVVVPGPGSLHSPQPAALQLHREALQCAPQKSGQVQVITVSSQEAQLIDPVQEAWKLATSQHNQGSSLGTVQFPIYGFEMQHGRIPVIASNLEQQRSLQQQQQFHDPNIRYFSQ